MHQDHEKREMNALVWLGPRTMEMRFEPVPETAAGDVLIEVDVAGICGSELSGYLGQNALRKPPLIMGHEAVGRLVQINGEPLADGSSGRVGTRVTFNPLIVCGSCDRCRAGYSNLCRRRQLIGAQRPGAFARFVAVPAAQCWPLPDELPDVVGALTEPLACAVRAVSLSQAQPGMRLLILGVGPIGLFCLAAARAQGIEAVLVSDLSRPRLEVARRWGAQEAINAREEDVVAVVHELVPGGVDAVIDAVGATVTRAQGLKAVVPGGRVVVIGLHDEESLVEMNYVVRQEVTIVGCFAYSKDDFGRAFALLTRGLIQAGADWLEERPLAAGPEAFAELVDGTARATKIVLRV